jgi:hypothetical protein
MYSFAQRRDTNVLDEPFYAVYLSVTQVEHPGKSDVVASMPTSEGEVRKRIDGCADKPVLFIKNMAHHMEVLSHPFVRDAVNVFLIRNPLHIITSYSAVIEKPVMRDIGIEFQYHLFKQLVSAGEKPVVLDSGLLLEDPETVLAQLCDACGIAFDPAMLHWKPGPKPYDGVWATHWYANVHQSSGFSAQMTRNRTLDPALEPLLVKANELYEKLLPFSLKA